MNQQHPFTKILLLLIIPFVFACTSNTKTIPSSFDYGTKNDSARYHFFKGWEEVMDYGRWTESEEHFRKAAKLDPDWLLAKSLIGRITKNLNIREEIQQQIESSKNQVSEYERLLLDVNLLSIKTANNNDKGIKNSEAFYKKNAQIAETKLGMFSRKFPEDNYFKAEYIEYLHHNHGAKVALDSLNILATKKQMKLGFYISYLANLELELGNNKKAIALLNKLNNTLKDSSFTSPLILKTKIYMAQDSLKKAKVCVDKIVKMDPKQLIALDLQAQINSALKTKK